MTNAIERMTIKVSPEAHHNLRVVSAMAGIALHKAAEAAIQEWCNQVLTQMQHQSGLFHGLPKTPDTDSSSSAVSNIASMKLPAAKKTS